MAWGGAGINCCETFHPNIPKRPKHTPMTRLFKFKTPSRYSNQSDDDFEMGAYDRLDFDDA